MVTYNNLILGYTDYTVNRSPKLFEIHDEELIKYYSHKKLVYGRLLLSLARYLQHTNKFNKVFVYITNQFPTRFSNGTDREAHGKLNNSEVDIEAKPCNIDEITMERNGFSYPYEINDFTFVTFKPEYTPHIFGIFQTFSTNVWITLAIVLCVIPLVSLFVLKHKCSFGKIIFHTFAILLKQTALIIPSSITENLLIYSWVIGAMILCLSHDSVFLSFLSFPPLTKVKHLSDLAVAVQKGDFNCIAFNHSGVEHYLRSTEHLEVIADDISKNDLRFKPLYNNFVRVNRTMNLAFFMPTYLMGLFHGKYFISEDRFFEAMGAMSVRRGFCCKELLDTFVHRLMA